MTTNEVLPLPRIVVRIIEKVKQEIDGLTDEQQKEVIKQVRWYIKDMTDAGKP